VHVRFPSTLLIVSFLAGGASAAAARDVSGVVVDESGRTLPRARVRATDASGRELAAVFTDEAGRFRFAAPDEDCRVEASLTGFAPATFPCDTAQPLRVALAVAPIQETVVVTATRTEAPAGQVGASVTVFTAEDLERRRVPLVADLLRGTPGAAVVRAGAPGGVTSLFVRGGESSYNKVLLDGIPLNEPGGTFNFSGLTTDNLDRLEIVRGAQSALFGSDAMASVVQLITKRAAPGARPGGSAWIEGGTYATARGGGQVAGTSGPFDYSFGASGLTTDNREPNSAFRNATISGAAGVVLGGSATLRFVGRTERQHNGTPGQTAFGRPDLDAFFEQHDGVGGATVDHQPTPAFRERASYSLSILHQQSTNLVADPPYTPRFDGRTAPFEFADFLFATFNTLRRHHASYQADLRLANDAARGSHLLTLAADWDGERAALEDRRAGTSTPASRDNVGVVVQHQAIWRRVVATASGRVERNASFGTAAVPRGAVVFVAHEAGAGRAAIGETRLRASAGLGIKEPTVLQSFSPSPFFRGNPDLEAERSRTVEAGIEQRVAGDRIRIEATWFDNRFRNLISTRTTNPATFEAQFFNIGLTRARGAELAADAAPAPAIRVRGGYTFLDSEIVDSTSPSSVVLAPGKWLFRRPRHSGFVDASWSRGRIAATVSGVFVGRFVDSDFASLQPPILEHPPYSTWDARLSYSVAPRAAILMSIDNLANADYMEPLGYPALKRAIRVGLRIGF